MDARCTVSSRVAAPPSRAVIAASSDIGPRAMSEAGTWTSPRWPPAGAALSWLRTSVRTRVTDCATSARTWASAWVRASPSAVDSVATASPMPIMRGTATAAATRVRVGVTCDDTA